MEFAIPKGYPDKSTMNEEVESDIEKILKKGRLKTKEVNLMKDEVEDLKKALEPGKVIRVPSPEDPWVHRSSKMKCKTCMYYVAKLSTPPDLGPLTGLGRCRRHAPTMSGFPVVFPTDWCGDHKLNENCT